MQNYVPLFSKYNAEKWRRISYFPTTSVGLPCRFAYFFCLIFLLSLCRARTASYYQLNDGASHAQIPPARPGSGLYRVQAPSRAAFTTPLVRLCRYAVMLRHHETLVIIIRALYTMRERARARSERPVWRLDALKWNKRISLNEYFKPACLGWYR